MIDLDAEFGRAIMAVPLDDSGPVGEWLARRGLTAERRRLVGALGIMRATLSHSAMTFEPHEDGERVLVAAMWDGPACEPDCTMLHLSELEDLAAWRPTAPEALFLRTGNGTIVGREGLRLATNTASPLRLHRTVEDLIRYGGECAGEYPAAVLVNPSMAWFHLSNLSAIIVDGVEHGTALEKLLAEQRPALPPIRIPASTLQVAA